MNLEQLDKVIPKERLNNIKSSLSCQDWEKTLNLTEGMVSLCPEVVNDESFSHRLEAQLSSGSYTLGLKHAQGHLNLKSSICTEEGAKVLLIVSQEWLLLNEEMLEQHIDIEVSENSHLELIVLGVKHHAGVIRSFFNINIKKNAQVQVHCLVTQGSFAHQRFLIALKEQGASCNLHSLSLTQKNNFLGVQCVITHEAPHTTSNASLRALLAGPSHTVQQGQIVVLPGSHKIEGKYNNKNIVLSPRAQLYTQPALEISCDDVVCAHGVSIAGMSDQEAFYLQARGIDKEQAQKLLLTGLCDQIIDLMPVNVYTDLEHDLTQLLTGR